MKKINLEFVVGLFVIMGFSCFVYISLQFGEFSVFSIGKNYTITADFTNVSGLKPGATIEMAGVEIGRVLQISLGKEDQARVLMTINNNVPITEDSMAAVKTQGIIGDKYISIIPGGSEQMIPNGGVITETQSAVDLEGLLSKYIFGQV